MGYTSTEFAAVLPAAMRDWTVAGGPSRWQVSGPRQRAIATIEIRALPARVIGALRIPVLAVSIDLRAASDTLAMEFMRRFERGFHRGGG